MVPNQYNIIRVLGAGGFGITYLAREGESDYEVAIKEYSLGKLAIRTVAEVSQ